MGALKGPGRQPRGRPRAEPSEIQRRRILDAARDCFAKVGYDAATVADIAERARVARPVVYETVGDKAALLAAVADEIAAELAAAIDQRFAAAAALERPLLDLIRDDVAWFMARVRSDPALVALFRTAGRFGRHANAPADRARRRIEDRLTELHHARARALGIEAGESARLLAVVLLALMEAAAFRSADEPAWPAAEAAHVVAEFVTGGYLRVTGEGVGALRAFARLVAASRSDESGAGET
jgi:AcrR family transcriptional regulator